MSTTRPRSPLVPNFSSMTMRTHPRATVSRQDRAHDSFRAMIRERGKGATIDEVARALQAFARAADTRKSYAAHHAVVVRAMSDLTHALDSLLKDLPELTIDVGPDALTFQGERVLEGAQPEGSIPFAL